MNADSPMPMNLTQLLPNIANLQEAEREAGAPLRTPDALRAAGYRIVQERDGDRYFLAKPTQLQPLLVRLGDIAEVRRGFTTGANEFFYLEPIGATVAQVMAGTAGATVRVKNGAGWQGEIETDWLRPVIKSPRELKTLRVRPEDLRYLVFMPPDDLRPDLPQLASSGELQKRYPKAWAYIHWGEKQGYQNNPTCKARQIWWGLDKIPVSFVLIPQFFRQIPHITYNPCMFLTDHTFYFLEGLSDPKDALLYAAILNASLTYVYTDIVGRTNQSGLITFYGPEWKQLSIPNPAAFTAEQRERLLTAFEQMASREVRSIFEELGLPKPNRDYSNIDPDAVSLERVLPDRRALDAVVFEVLGLNEQEQLAVYRAVVELVKSRLVKARSVG